MEKPTLPQPSQCPDADTLWHFQNGTLDDARAQSVTAHVEQCERCREAVHRARSTLGADETQISQAGRSPVRWRPGDVVGEFTLERQVGEGGMGAVWAAHDAALQRTVAIKCVTTAGTEAWARFEREVVLTARLQHPAIVTVFGRGRLPSGHPWYVMKLVKGRSLEQLINECHTLEQRLALVPSVMTAVNALAFAHQAGVIHRDLKPANIVVGDLGETVVIDWGLARVVDEDALEQTDPRASGTPSSSVSNGQTVTGSVMGTPVFMPREQALGERLGPRADVYALGVILYATLSGRLPYPDGPVVRVLSDIVRGPGAPLEAPGLPADLRSIVTRATAYRAEDRYPSATELAADLRQFLAGQLVGAHQYSPSDHVKRWLERHRATVLVASAAAVALAALAGASIDRLREQTELAQTRRIEADATIERVVADTERQLARVQRVDLLEKPARDAQQYFDRGTPPFWPLRLRRQAVMHATVARALESQGQWAQAATELSAARARVAELRQREPENPLWLYDEASSLRDLTRHSLHAGALEQAHQQVAQALQLDEQVGRAVPDDPQVHLAAIEDRALLAQVVERQGDAAGAAALRTTARAALAEAASHWPEEPQLESLRQALTVP